MEKENCSSKRNADLAEYFEPGQIDLSDLLQCLVESSEKAAKIAQIFRGEDDLFDLLVQEKSQDESNKRFVQDFKTLADVLVQETIKKDVGQKFPELVSQIRGEEQNSFKNVQGDSIEVVLTDSPEDTITMLVKVLNGKKHTAQAIAEVVHSSEIVSKKQCHMNLTYPIRKLGIWIDPIDSTAEFIEGKYDETKECGLQPYGLNCVCVLIGAYDLETFSTVLGVINQPFYRKSSEKEKWQSRFYWGIVHCNNSLASPNVTGKDPVFHRVVETKETRRNRIVVISSSENPELQEVMKREYQVIHAAGAGYKALLVAIDKADLYFLSKGTTYYWDTCAPHAILNSVGGGLLNLKSFLDSDTLDSLQETQVKYEAKQSESGTAMFQNCEGILAYRDSSLALEFLNYLKSNGYDVK